MNRQLGELAKGIRDGSNSAHAYIIEAKAGEERDKMISDLCKALICESPKEDGSPCACCNACRQYEAGASMDISVMEKSGKTGYLTKDAEGFIEKLRMSAYGSLRIGVIMEAELLPEIVQNKLLKTLEEPEKGTKIIIACSNMDKLLATVRSRCSEVRIDAVGSESCDDKIAALTLEMEDAVHFYKFRELVDKKLASVEETNALLTRFEELLRDKMFRGEDMLGCANAIEAIERAREDIFKGMQGGKALKKLYLELSK